MVTADLLSRARSMLRVVTFGGTYLDSGTHADYLAASLLAGFIGTREAIAAAGVLMLATPLLLPRRALASRPEPEPEAEPEPALGRA
jgi:hypothetical protein